MDHSESESEDGAAQRLPQSDTEGEADDSDDGKFLDMIKARVAERKKAENAAKKTEEKVLIKELKRALGKFEKLDTDNSGFLEVGELKQAHPDKTEQEICRKYSQNELAFAFLETCNHRSKNEKSRIVPPIS